MKYSEEFQKTVQWVCTESDKFYEKCDKENTPNPFYLGFGNPNSKILIIGKELGFEQDKTKQLQDESINNPYQWQRKINGEKFSETEFNPEIPYFDWIPPKEGHTWNKYEKLNRLIDNEFKVNKTEVFKSNFFFTEMNPVPSKYSKGLSKDTKKQRISFFKHNDYFQQFKIVILAFGNYLKEKEIRNIFQIDEVDCSLNKARNKLVIFQDKEKERLIIHTRQLSVDTSNKLLEQIANTINKKRNLY